MSDRRRIKQMKDRFGSYLIITDRAPDEGAAVAMAEDIRTTADPEYHLWNMRVQRSDRGRRCEVEVWMRLTE